MFKYCNINISLLGLCAFRFVLSVVLLSSVIPPGDVGIVSTFGFTRGRETEAACSGEYLPDPDENDIYLAASSVLSS